jgi:hypothetical protein
VLHPAGVGDLPLAQMADCSHSDETHFQQYQFDPELDRAHVRHNRAFQIGGREAHRMRCEAEMRAAKMVLPVRKVAFAGGSGGCHLLCAEPARKIRFDMERFNYAVRITAKVRIRRGKFTKIISGYLSYRQLRKFTWPHVNGPDKLKLLELLAQHEMRPPAG